MRRLRRAFDLREWRSSLYGIERCHTSHQPANWISGASPQEAFLKAGMVDLFSQHGQEHHCLAFWRWFLYWCSPIWVSWAWVLLVMMWVLINGEFSKHHLNLLVVVWTAYSLTFLFSQVRYFCRDQLYIDDAMLGRLVPGMRGVIARASLVSTIITDRTFLNTASFVQAVVMAALLALVRIMG